MTFLKTDFNVSRKHSSSLFDGDVKERHTGDSILSEDEKQDSVGGI